MVQPLCGHQASARQCKTKIFWSALDHGSSSQNSYSQAQGERLYFISTMHHEPRPRSVQSPTPQPAFCFVPLQDDDVSILHLRVARCARHRTGEWPLYFFKGSYASHKSWVVLLPDFKKVRTSDKIKLAGEYEFQWLGSIIGYRPGQLPSFKSLVSRIPFTRESSLFGGVWNVTVRW